MSTQHRGNPKMQMLFVPGEITMREHCFDRVETLVKHAANPLLKADKPWEGKGVYWPTFLYSEEERVFKMWYYTLKGESKRVPRDRLIDNADIQGRSLLCYACSEDGLEWEKPALRRVNSGEYPDNNILLTDSGWFLGTIAVIEDRDDPDTGRRYKMLLYDNDGMGTNGVRTGVSPNGLDWTFVGGFPVLPSQDTPALWHDRRRGEYVAFLKDRLDNRRARLVSVSRDFETWSEPQVLLAPAPGDSATEHYYGQSAFHHCGRDLGFLNIFEFSTQRLYLELIAGAGSSDWRRLPSRPKVLEPGDHPAWDSNMVFPGLGEPIVRGDTCWYYYYGSSQRHDAAGETGAIGLATFKSGRLVGQQIEGEGWFQTLPFRCPGGTLHLDAVACKPMTVEAHSTGYGGPRPGYTRSECRPVEGDSRSHEIRWAEKSNIDGLRNEFIVLRIYGCNSIAYGVEFR